MFNYDKKPIEMKFNNRGRLSRKETKRMMYCLQTYYDEMIGINQTSKKTGIHHRTVSKYFKTMDKEFLKSEGFSFIELCKITKSHRIESLERDIINCTESENVITALITTALEENNMKKYLSLHESLNKKITIRLKLQDQKMELINTITFDIDIASEIKKIQKPSVDSSCIIISKDMIPEIDNFSDTMDNLSCNKNYTEKSHNPQNNLSDTISCNIDNLSNIDSDTKNNLTDNTDNYSDNDGTHNYPGRKLVP